MYRQYLYIFRIFFQSISIFQEDITEKNEEENNNEEDDSSQIIKSTQQQKSVNVNM